MRKLRAAAGLSAGTGSRHRTGRSRRIVARACGAGRALSVLRQCPAQRLQLARELPIRRRCFAPPAATTAPSPTSQIPRISLHWRKIEFAKHRLFYTLLRLRLPLATRLEDPNGLAFDFLSNPIGAAAAHSRVMTGHASGLITLNVAEADDPERERQRKSMGEPYRTLLGHFRHEIAHYYWDRLVADSPRDRGVPAAVRRRARGLRGVAAAATTPMARRPTGRSASSPPMPARIRGKISPKPGRTISIWSIRSRPPSRSVCGCGRRWPRAPIYRPP